MEELEYIQDLIIANATGNISREEKKILFDWIKYNESNLLEYNRLTSLCNRTSLVMEWDAVDLDNAQVSFKNIAMPKRIVTIWLGVVASVVVILTVSLLLIHQNNLQVNKDGISEIISGRSKAVLTLSDGSIVSLGNKDANISGKLAGVDITDKSSGTITYDKIFEPEEAILKYNTIKVPRGGEYQLVLSDGTKVWLNSETTIQYPVTFIGKTREVKLIGEAYFEVAHNKRKPFIVNSEVTKVKVLGTSFNYKAYRGDESTEVTLAEGKVSVVVGNNSYMLVPGKQASVNRANREAKVCDVDVDNFISWKDGVFQFIDMPIKDIANNLSRWYNVEFVFEKESLKYERFSGAVTKYRSIRYILDIIEETKDLKFEIKKEKIIVK